jgi:hypothetical protein
MLRVIGIAMLIIAMISIARIGFVGVIADLLLLSVIIGTIIWGKPMM